jgi:hypothetical protein
MNAFSSLRHYVGSIILPLLLYSQHAPLCFDEPIRHSEHEHASILALKLHPDKMHLSEKHNNSFEKNFM